MQYFSRPRQVTQHVQTLFPVGPQIDRNPNFYVTTKASPPVQLCGRILSAPIVFDRAKQSRQVSISLFTAKTAYRIFPTQVRDLGSACPVHAC